MAVARLKHHSQDLEDVMIVLERCGDRRAEQAFSLAHRGALHALNETDLKPLRSRTVSVFPEDPEESPVLSGIEELPFASLPTKALVERILKDDIGGTNSFMFAPSRGSPEKDAYATMKLLDNIGNPGYGERGAVIHMQSPTFDQLRSKKLAWQADGLLGQSNFQMTVAPAHEVFDLVYYENYMFSMLLTGSKVWIAYPPFHNNPAILQQRYEELQRSKSGPVFMQLSEKLQHGIAIVQKPAQTLMLPPFWSFMVFCTETSTSAEQFLATARKFMERLVSINMYLSVLRMWPSKEREQVELVKYVDSLATHLDMILKNSCKPFKADGVIRELCVKWENPTGTGFPAVKLKDELSRLCATIEDKEVEKRLTDKILQAWHDFLESKKKKIPECRMCHMRIEHMPYTGTPSARLREHFVHIHWRPVDLSTVGGKVGEKVDGDSMK
jgi:hypothetical protein